MLTGKSVQPPWAAEGRGKCRSASKRWRLALPPASARTNPRVVPATPRTSCATWTALRCGTGAFVCGPGGESSGSCKLGGQDFVLGGSRGLRTIACVVGGCPPGCGWLPKAAWVACWRQRVARCYCICQIFMTKCGRGVVCISDSGGCAFPFTFQCECACERAWLCWGRWVNERLRGWKVEYGCVCRFGRLYQCFISLVMVIRNMFLYETSIALILCFNI